MTPAEMDTILRGLGWSRSELARRLDRTEGVVRRWKTVPAPVAVWLYAMICWTLAAPQIHDMPKNLRHIRKFRLTAPEVCIDALANTFGTAKNQTVLDWLRSAGEQICVSTENCVGV